MKDISQSLKILGGKISENSPALLTGLSVIGLVTTVALAIRDTPDAWMRLSDEETRREMNRDVPYTALSVRDVVQLTWRCYIPTIGVGAATIACMVGSHSISHRRSAALASLYGITEAALREYQSKVVETIGHSKERRIRDEIASDELKKNPPSTAPIIFTGKGEVMCYDTLSGRYFKSDIEHIRRSINELNRQLMTDMFLSVNDFYYLINLPSIPLGEDMGWHVDDGLLEIDFSSHLTEDGAPCLVLAYEVAPRYGR